MHGNDTTVFPVGVFQYLFQWFFFQTCQDVFSLSDRFDAENPSETQLQRPAQNQPRLLQHFLRSSAVLQVPGLGHQRQDTALKVEKCQEAGLKARPVFRRHDTTRHGTTRSARGLRAVCAAWMLDECGRNPRGGMAAKLYI